MSPKAPQKVSFGFLLPPIQLLDMAGPMDVLQNVCTDFVKTYSPFLVPDSSQVEEAISNSLDITFHHIGMTMEPVKLTGGFLAQPTVTAEKCPHLDYLLVGGTDPMWALKPESEDGMPEAMKDFIRERSKSCKTVFSTCTGAILLGVAGVLDGVNATVNHTFIEQSKQYLPKVKWDGSKNWVIDGKFWTAGGACAGMDMMAQWAREQVGEQVFSFVTLALEYQPRDVDGKMMSFLNGRGEMVKV